MKSIEIDRSKTLAEEPHKGHNRWHPDVPPVLEVEEGEEVVLETRESTAGQVRRSTTVQEFVATVEEGMVHGLTGPVFVKGAAPGDLLEVEFLDILPQPWGFTFTGPGWGVLRDPELPPFLARWDIADGWATSADLPGVRLPAAPFMGVSGVAPSPAQVAAWTARERELAARGGRVPLPKATGAVPSSGPVATHGLRTIPPRENGGNLDAKQLTRGSKLQLPVFVPGALFSTGDGHFTQGDGEVCGTAVEMGATVALRFRVLKGMAERHRIATPRFVLDNADARPAFRRFIATTGMCIREDGTNEDADFSLACRNALLAMVDLLQERGWSRGQAYVICSVAADLKVTQGVNAPNVIVSAFLPEDIFQG